MLWFFLIFSTVSWGIAEIFYKKGNVAEERYAHLKTSAFVGICMGIYATIVLFTQGIDLKAFPKNFLIYAPVAACYILSMTLSYFGVRFIQESISDPIENTSGAFVPLLCVIFLHEKLTYLAIIAIVVVVIGILGVGFFDKNGTDNRKKNLGKKLAVWAILMPFFYMILDTVGTFLDVFYTDGVETTLLVSVTEDNLENTANCAYEFWFLLYAIGILIFLAVKKEPLFHIPAHDTEEFKESYSKMGFWKKLWTKVWGQHDKIIAAIFETAGQATYLFALSEGSGIAAVILGAGTVIISFILSRIILKEKLTIFQYGFIAVVFAGIIMLSLVPESWDDDEEDSELEAMVLVEENLTYQEAECYLIDESGYIK